MYTCRYKYVYWGLVLYRLCNPLCTQGLQAPSQVTGVSLSKSVRQGRAALIVTWTTPQSDVNINQYHVQYRKNGTTSWGSQLTISGSPPATSTILTGLDAGTEYNIRVRARANSTAGDGEWSVEQTERTFDSEFTCIICCYQLLLCLWHIYIYKVTIVLFSASQPVVL